jgi:hypothetical protein
VDSPAPLTDEEQRARFRVALATGRLPRDLGEWALAKLTPASERRAVRDAHLMEAARYLPFGGPWRKARLLEVALRGPTPSFTLGWHLARAQASDACPRSLRQLLRVLTARYAPQKAPRAALTSPRRPQERVRG